MNPNKTEAIEALKAPGNKIEVKYFLGLINYYRRFIKDCSKIVKSLSEFRKNNPFIWSNEEEKAFLRL